MKQYANNNLLRLLGLWCRECSGSRNLVGFAYNAIDALINRVANRRDVEADARVGRLTLAIMAGPTVTNRIYAAMMLVPLALLFPIGRALTQGDAWPALILLPLAARLKVSAMVLND